MVQKRLHARRIGAEGEQQKAAGQSKVLQKIPERVAAAAEAFQPEVRSSPELFPQERGSDAIKRQNERGKTIRDAGENGGRHRHFDAKSANDQRLGREKTRYRMGRLADRLAKIQQLIESAERQKQSHQQTAYGDFDANTRQIMLHRRSLRDGRVIITHTPV